MNRRKDYNRFGEQITSKNLKIPLREEYINSQGTPKWDQFIQNGDRAGFDIHNIESNGSYIQKVILPKGKKVIRFGFSGGVFTTDEGTEYSSLSLPYTESSMPYHEYIVVGKCEVECLVDRGRVAPGFGSLGGAVQYRHYNTMKESLSLGILMEDTEWLKSKRQTNQ